MCSSNRKSYTAVSNKVSMLTHRANSILLIETVAYRDFGAQRVMRLGSAVADDVGDALLRSQRNKPTPNSNPAASAISHAPCHVGRRRSREATQRVPRLTQLNGRNRYPAQPMLRRITPTDAVTIATMISSAVPLRIKAGWRAKRKGTT